MIEAKHRRPPVFSHVADSAIGGGKQVAEQNPARENWLGREIYEWVDVILSSFLIVIFLFIFAFRIMGVDGHSMVPTLQDKDVVLVLSPMLNRDFRYGDIVIFRKGSFNERPLVKRVIATGGQSVDIDFDNGAVYVDGELLDEPYIRELTFLQEGTSFPLTVPEGSIFVMGDNRNGSTDSRSSRLGTVDTRYIIGRVAMVLFPGKDYSTEKRDFSRIGLIARL